MNTLTSSNLSDNTVDPLHPLSASGKPLRWDNNDATIDGLLHEVHESYHRTRDHLELIEHGVASLYNGKIAIDSFPSISFFEASAADRTYDPRSWDDPCPPTPTRKAEFEERLKAANALLPEKDRKPTPAFITTKDDVDSSIYIVNQLLIDKADARAPLATLAA